MNKIHNIFHDIPQSADEIIQDLVRSDKVRIERIVSYGNASPDGFWYEQEENEWVILMQGSAKLEFSDRIVVLNKGDYLFIPAREKHRVADTATDETTIWLAVFWT